MNEFQEGIVFCLVVEIVIFACIVYAKLIWGAMDKMFGEKTDES